MGHTIILHLFISVINSITDLELNKGFKQGINIREIIKSFTEKFQIFPLKSFKTQIIMFMLSSNKSADQSLLPTNHSTLCCFSLYVCKSVCIYLCTGMYTRTCNTQVLHRVIITGYAQGTIWDVEDQVEVGSEQGKCPTRYTTTLVLNTYF